MPGRVVSDDEGYEEEEDLPVDQEAGEEAEDNDEEDEDDEGPDEYEKDDFIVDDDEEEPEEDDGGNSDEERHKKKKRKKRESKKNYDLDEDDYELLEDNNIGFHRPKAGSTKFKRLKKAGRDGAGGGHSGFSDEEETNEEGKGGKTAEEKLKRTLFGDDEAAPPEDIADEEEQQEEEEDVDLGEEDEMADFIVDEEEEFDEDGAPVRRKKIKKKKLRQAPGVSSSALQEAHEIFGDVDELLTLRKKGLAANASGDGSEWGDNRLENEFDPLVIEKNYMTQRDEQIRDADTPERFQLSEEITGPPPTDNQIIKEEAAWIYNQLVSEFPSFFDREHEKEHEEHIFNVLRLIHTKNDIPFIATYRKELCFTLLKDPDEDLVDEGTGSDRTPRLKWHKILWAIQNLDVKWLLIQKRKNALHGYYTKRFEEEARRIDDETRIAMKRKLFRSIIESLKDAKSQREVDDVDMKFNLHFPPGEVDEGQYKRPTRRSLYSECCKSGLWEVASKFGRSPEQFGLALEKMEADELEDSKEGPDELAIHFTCKRFKEAKDVLDGARHMASVEISCEPSVRKHVRTTFMSNAVVSTSPTPEGNTLIDSSHQFFGVKWLKDKPLSKFLDAQWLLVQKAEEEKLLQVSIKLPGDVQEKLMADFRTYYLSENVRKSAQLWNAQREQILNDSFSKYMLPSMEKEARSQLTTKAKNWLMKEYGRQLWKKISVGPCQNKNRINEEESAPSVMACCWGPGKPATTFVMLDSAGEVVDVLYAGSINARSQGIHEQRKKNDQQRLRKFMTDHQPDVVCVGAANVQCRTLKDEINETIYNIIEDHPRDVGSDFELNPVFADEALPRLYENSNISSDQLPGQPGIVKRAVALGRYIQNPLAMVATLCGREREILSWKLCSLESFLDSDEKYGVVEQVMVDVTNQVGIDVNLASSHEWLFAPLQFISGLGPRKASALQRTLVRLGSVFTRKEIAKGIPRKKDFLNAIGFIRVRRSGTASITSHIMDPLDDTRIHPESYGLAKRMAKDAYYGDQIPEDAELDEETQEMLIDHVREKPHQLRALIIDEYAESIELESGSRKRETLSDIKRELLHGFEDWRIPYSEPNADEQFQMISGESDESISEGRTVQVSVRFVQEQRVVCQFDSGLKGILSIADFTDRHIDTSELQEMVHEGDVLTCKIKGVDTARCQVYLTHKQRDLDRPYAPKEVDDFFTPEHTVVRGEDKARKDKERAKRHFKPRMIVHPRFQNLTADEAMELLSDKEAGESIIRPSRNGPSHLTLTLKVYDGVYAHKEIIEGGKDHKDITSLLRIGKKLTIGDDTFEDLDELMDRYVDPLVSHLKNMLGYRKFRKGIKEEVDARLRAEKAETPNRIVYCFGISHDNPGSFILTYIRSSNPHHEYIGLYPKGFRFRKKEFDNIDRLVSYFQKHIDEVPLDSGLSMKSLAAVVPIRSPGNGGSGGGTSIGGNWGDGWGGQADPDGERSTPGSRGGRFDHRNNMRDGHPSGIPRPFGRGRGRGRGRGNSNHEGQDSDFGYSKWGSDSNDKDDGLSSFPGAKFQNSPGREKFPGSWAGNAGGNTGSWGGGSGGGGHSSWGGGGRGGGEGSWGGGGSQDNRDDGTAGNSWGGAGSGTAGNEDNRHDGTAGNSWGGAGSGTGGWTGGPERGTNEAWAGSGSGASSSRSWDQSGDKAPDDYNKGAATSSTDWDASKKTVPAQTESRGGWSGGSEW